jgi:hypothetical protein
VSDAHRRLSLRGVTSDMLAAQIHPDVLREALKKIGYVETLGRHTAVSPLGVTVGLTGFEDPCYYQARLALVAPWAVDGCTTAKESCACPEIAGREEIHG